MKRIFEIELIKLRHGKTTKVIAIIYAVITILSLIVFTYLYKSSVDTYQTYGGGGENLDNFPPLSFPFVWLVGAWVSSLLVIFPAILAVLHASNEFSSKIHRQHIIDGLSRDEYIISKIFSIIIISLSFTIYTAFLCIIMGLINNTGDIIPQELLDAMSNHVFRDTHPLIWLFGYFLYTLCILSFGLLISFIFKNTGRSIFAFVGYYLVLEWIILSFLVKSKLFLVAKLLPVWSVANNIFPNTITGNGLKAAEMESNGTLHRLNEEDILKDLLAFDVTDSLIAIIYIGIYFLLIRWIFLRRDL